MINYLSQEHRLTITQEIKEICPAVKDVLFSLTPYDNGYEGIKVDVVLHPDQYLSNEQTYNIRSYISETVEDSDINELKGEVFPVLDKGSIELRDVMGSDEAIVEAARTSYSKNDGDDLKKKSDNRTLIRYLMKHRHTTPFEMAEIKVLVHVPMDCWRQWIRHRTANVNEYSTRYSLAIDDCQSTNEWRSQSGTNKQGSDGLISGEINGVPVSEYLSARETDFHNQARDLYLERIDLGVAREQARKDLPLSTYTRAYWKCDLHNILHFLALRMDSHAQKEIREYAVTLGERIVAPLFPLVWEAFVDYRLEAMYLSRLDVLAISTGDHKSMTTREKEELWTKLEKLGV